MTNRQAVAACWSPGRRAAWLTELYPNTEVRAHMLTVADDLVLWAAVRGRHAEARAWLSLSKALTISLATARKRTRKDRPPAE